MPLSAGKRLGSHEILATIGVGGMGEVYKARDTRLERIVAIKVLPDHVARDADLKQRFEREAKAISSLTHPHICTLYDVGSADGVEFLVLEYLEGETVAQRLASGPMPVQQVLRYGAEIADALESAHRRGITHRDLKPGNVMLTKAGAKLLDFGLAKLKPVAFERGAASAPTLAPDLTGSGAILGTLQYMAPEQLEGGTVDHRADVFAFGALLYEMATGKTAFEGRSQASLIGSILRDEPRPISELQPLTPQLLDAIVATCLAKDPDDRWQSAGDVGRQLRLLRGSAPPHGAAAGPLDGGPAGAARAARAAWILAAVATLVAAGLAARQFLRTEPRLQETHVEIVSLPTPDALSFAISPDGRKLAFVAGDDESKALWVRSLDSTSAQLLPGTTGASYPFWSPDNRSIGFFAGGKLKRIDIAAGQPREIADASEGRGGAWSHDDVILFTPAPGSRMERVSAAGGEISSAGSVVGARFPQFLPGSRRYIYHDVALGVAANRRRGVYLGSLDSAEVSFLASSDAAAQIMPPDWLFFINGTVLFAQRFDARSATMLGSPVVVSEPVGYDANVFASAFSVSSTGTVAYRANARTYRQLTWFDRSGRASGVVGAPDERDMLWPELSPDESRVAVVRLIGSTRSSWIADVDRGVLSVLADDPVSGSARWSPDGERLAYFSIRPEGSGLRIRDLTRGTDELVLARTLPAATRFGGGASDWSKDGRFLVLTLFDEATQSDLWVLPLEGDRTLVPLLVTRYEEDSAQFSPDDRWIAYRSEESGRSEVYLQAFPGPGPKVQVSKDGGAEPRWSADGTELYFMSLDAKLMAASVRRVDDGPPRIGAANALFRTRKVRAGAITAAIQQYDVSRDGRFLINVTVQSDSPEPISLLLNWNLSGH